MPESEEQGTSGRMQHARVWHIRRLGGSPTHHYGPHNRLPSLYISTMAIYLS